MSSFTEKLSAEAVQFFNMVCAKPFSEQAVHFLNAYWHEVGSQAEFIFSVAWDHAKKADMKAKNINYVHQYEEGNDFDFNFGLYFYEQLCRFLEEEKNAQWVAKDWSLSQPEMMTAIKRKQELREKVDVNFDGRVSFLEYLLYQYRDYANPADFCVRSMNAPDEHPEIRKARLALQEVNKRIAEFEAEKQRLTEEAELPGVKGLAAKNLLAQLDASPQAERLNQALITAEAAVRIASKKFGGGKVVATGSVAPKDSEGRTELPTDGAIWWMNRDLEEKKKRYGPKPKK
jgi:hypothetical protein